MITTKGKFTGNLNLIECELGSKNQLFQVYDDKDSKATLRISEEQKKKVADISTLDKDELEIVNKTLKIIEDKKFTEITRTEAHELKKLLFKKGYLDKIDNEFNHASIDNLKDALKRMASENEVGIGIKLGSITGDIKYKGDVQDNNMKPSATPVNLETVAGKDKQ